MTKYVASIMLLEFWTMCLVNNVLFIRTKNIPTWLYKEVKTQINFAVNLTELKLNILLKTDLNF